MDQLPTILPTWVGSKGVGASLKNYQLIFLSAS